MKRLLQICFTQNVPFICGSLMLISEILKVKKHLFQLDHSMLSEEVVQSNDLEEKFGKEQDDEEEKFTDVKLESEDEKDAQSDEEPNGKVDNKSTAAASWVHKKNIIFKKHDKYDYHERNPMYCGADKTLSYELVPLTQHYHPTVVIFANKLMSVRNTYFIVIHIL